MKWISDGSWYREEPSDGSWYSDGCSVWSQHEKFIRIIHEIGNHIVGRMWSFTRLNGLMSIAKSQLINQSGATEIDR